VEAEAGGRTETSREERSATEEIGVGSVRQISTDGDDPHIARIFSSESAPTPAPLHPNILKMGSTRSGWISSTNQTHGKAGTLTRADNPGPPKWLDVGSDHQKQKQQCVMKPVIVDFSS